MPGTDTGLAARSQVMFACKKLGYTWAASTGPASCVVACRLHSLPMLIAVMRMALPGVDLDEYITTKRNTGRTLMAELQASFAHADAIGVPWVLMMNKKQARAPTPALGDLRH